MKVMGYGVQCHASQGHTQFALILWFNYVEVFHLKHHWSSFAARSGQFLKGIALFFVYRVTISACTQHIDPSCKSLMLKLPLKKSAGSQMFLNVRVFSGKHYCVMSLGYYIIHLCKYNILVGGDTRWKATDLIKSTSASSVRNSIAIW